MRKVTAPDGREWKLGRRWLPGRRRVRRPRMRDIGDGPWTVYGRTEGREWQRRVVGWRASGRALDEAAQRIASGAELEPAPRDGR